MLKWWRKNKAYSRLVSDEAKRLVHEYGHEAYSIARNAARAGRNRHKQDEARFFAHVAVEVAELTGKEIGLDTATRMAQSSTTSQA